MASGLSASDVADLIRKYGRSERHFSDLPPEFQDALRCYLSVYPPTRLVGIAPSVPMVDLIPLVMMGDDVACDFAAESFDEYHRWYVAFGPMPDHDVTKPLWPLVLDASSNPHEVLEDGWHRFHDYYRKGVRDVPCCWITATAAS